MVLNNSLNKKIHKTKMYLNRYKQTKKEIEDVDAYLVQISKVLKLTQLFESLFEIRLPNFS